MSEAHHPGEEPAAERPKPPGARYPVMVGVAFVALIAYATYDTVTGDDERLLGAGDEQGRALAEFAVPDVRGEVIGDANIFQDDCGSSDNPCPVDDRRVPACRISPAGVHRVCDFFDRPLAISFWFTGGADCLPQQDTFNAVAREYAGRANFLSINVRDEIEEVRMHVRERGWRVPVGWDRDGAVSNIYRVGLCPTLALAYPGGILHAAQVGTEAFTESSLGDSLDRLLEASRRREAPG